MPRPNPAPWIMATVVFLGVGLVGSIWGHRWALGLLLALLAAVAAFGGPRRDDEGPG